MTQCNQQRSEPIKNLQGRGLSLHLPLNSLCKVTQTHNHPNTADLRQTDRQPSTCHTSILYNLLIGGGFPWHPDALILNPLLECACIVLRELHNIFSSEEKRTQIHPHRQYSTFQYSNTGHILLHSDFSKPQADHSSMSPDASHENGQLYQEKVTCTSTILPEPTPTHLPLQRQLC